MTDNVWPKPPFTLSDLKQAIPKHCYERSFITSAYYLCYDVLTVIITVVGMYKLDPILWDISPQLWVLGWCIFVPYQGVNMMATWVLAHECGHGALFKQEWLNDVVGYTIHTMLGVPYYSWKYTHATHHRYTNTIGRDAVWTPDIATDNTKDREKLLTEAESKSHNTARIIIVSLLGWPVYLFTNFGSAKTEKPASHFEYCEIFKGKPKWHIMISKWGIIAWTMILLYACFQVGFFMMFRLYVLPYLVVNFFLVTITFLHHCDEKVPHLAVEQYDWLRAALCTVDRTMGSYLDKKLHWIHATHVAHHLFPYIPFYHSQEVTKAIKPVLGKYYTRDDSNYWIALWNNYKYWGTVENNSEGVYWWFDR
jgi:omega-6 fatty acid desaturase (delta-12 desaturase)